MEQAVTGESLRSRRAGTCQRDSVYGRRTLPCAIQPRGSRRCSRHHFRASSHVGDHYRDGWVASRCPGEQADVRPRHPQFGRARPPRTGCADQSVNSPHARAAAHGMGDPTRATETVLGFGRPAGHSPPARLGRTAAGFVLLGDGRPSRRHHRTPFTTGPPRARSTDPARALLDAGKPRAEVLRSRTGDRAVGRSVARSAGDPGTIHRRQPRRCARIAAMGEHAPEE